MYKVVIDEEFLRTQAEEMAEQVKLHTFNHIKIMLSEALKTPLSNEQCELVLNTFLEEFSNRTSDGVFKLSKEAEDYLKKLLNGR